MITQKYSSCWHPYGPSHFRMLASYIVEFLVFYLLFSILSPPSCETFTAPWCRVCQPANLPMMRWYDSTVQTGLVLRLWRPFLTTQTDLKAKHIGKMNWISFLLSTRFQGWPLHCLGYAEYNGTWPGACCLKPSFHW